ncbi:unnamed protein product [Amoebophrya sp. A120]|nr:unnamed protein product [Amoebophrya sp. A120]|eukprot:GSA120T00004077001.1
MPETEPKIEEVDSDSSSDAPNLEESKDGTKQNRAEKKCRKAVSKLGLRPFGGIVRVTVKKTKNILFVISKPEVMKAPSSETYVIFGEAKIEDVAASAAAQAHRQMQQSMQMQALKQQMEAAKGGASVADADTKEEPKIEEVVEDDSSGTKVEEKDIELIMTQVSTTREKAIKALKEHKNDIVEAIMSFN